MNEKTILVVEDDQTLVDLYREIFEKRGWQVGEAYDGEQAVQKALEKMPKAILLDLMLPKKGGLHVLKILKSLPETKPIPVIVITAYPNPEYQEDAFATGCDGYIVKAELPGSELVDKVEELLGRLGLEKNR